MFDSTLHNPFPDPQLGQNSVFGNEKTRKGRNGLKLLKEEVECVSQLQVEAKIMLYSDPLKTSIGIRTTSQCCILDPDPRWKKNVSGSEMNIPDHSSESLGKHFFVYKYFHSLMRIRIRDPESFRFRIRDEKIRIRDPGSGINIPDPQHCRQ